MVWTAVAASASRGGTGPNFMAALSCGQSCRLLPQLLGDLADNRDRDLGRRHRTDIEADRRMDAAGVVVGEAALGLQPLDTAGVGFPRAEGADVEAIAF